MRRRSNFLLGAAALAGLALSIGSAAAQSVQTEKLHVQASVGELCTVTAATLDFGPYAGQAITGSGSIEIDCLAETDLEVALDGGQSGNGQRHMSNGTDTLSYGLFVDAPNGGNPWDSDEAVPVTISGSSSVPVYGTVAGFQTGLSNGLYSDEVTITLIF